MQVVFILTLLFASFSLAFAEDQEPLSEILGADPQYFEAKARDGLDVVAANIKTKQLMHALQLGLERYSVDMPDHHYPDSIDLLIREGYLSPGLYVNPVTSVDGTRRNARDVPFGWSELAPGNFTYLKIYDHLGKVVSYALVAYGATLESSGEGDWNRDGVRDGIIIILESGLNRPDGSSGDLPGSQDYYAHGEKITVYFGQ